MQNWLPQYVLSAGPRPHRQHAAVVDDNSTGVDRFCTLLKLAQTTAPSSSETRRAQNFWFPTLSPMMCYVPSVPCVVRFLFCLLVGETSRRLMQALHTAPFRSDRHTLCRDVASQTP